MKRDGAVASLSFQHGSKEQGTAKELAAASNQILILNKCRP
jgi:hypothetical protein